STRRATSTYRPISTSSSRRSNTASTTKASSGRRTPRRDDRRRALPERPPPQIVASHRTCPPADAAPYPALLHGFHGGMAVEDRYDSLAAGLESPAIDGFAITPSDSADLPEL